MAMVRKVVRPAQGKGGGVKGHSLASMLLTVLAFIHLAAGLVLGAYCLIGGEAALTRIKSVDANLLVALGLIDLGLVVFAILKAVAEILGNSIATRNIQEREWGAE
ncbi:MAG: hypothetical protein QF662_01765 [Phycisphaerae bacterium]|jgi:hypothetical protein|nr:hypothetical protein [Phycisphaerae bacterium]